MFDAGSTVLVDPTAGALEDRIFGHTPSFIPMHSVVCIEEVDKQGSNKISAAIEQGENVTPFRLTFSSPKRD